MDTLSIRDTRGDTSTSDNQVVEVQNDQFVQVQNDQVVEVQGHGAELIDLSLDLDQAAEHDAVE